MPDRRIYNVMIVDDHPVVRAGIAAVLSSEPDLRICCQAESEQALLSKTLVCIPDLSIIDLSLLNSSGLSLLEILLRRFPSLRILVLSMHDETVYAPKVIKAGAHGYLMKQEATTTLVAAVRALLRGQIFVSERMREILMQQLTLRGSADTGEPGLMTLTKTELTVLNFIGMGLGNREIAEQMRRSIKTINAHCTNIQQKLNLPNSRALQRFALHWIQPPPD